MSPSAAPITYRLRSIPAYVKKNDLASFLKKHVADLAVAGDIQVHSLAPSIGDWSRPALQTATISFREQPNGLQDSRNEWHFTIPGQRLPLLLDTHFLDFTVLNDVDDEHHAIDCVAISGLASHPFGSWRYREPTGAPKNESLNWMWLRDQLPVDLESVRVMTYGYDTRLDQSHSFQTIDDIALFFILKLSTMRPAGSSRKPLIFLGHSLGGLVVKSALLHLAESGKYERSLLEDIKSIFFFGVPSKGMHISHLLSMVQNQPNQQLVEALSEQSAYLSVLNEKMSGVSLYSHIRLISAYETEMSPTAVQMRDGKWVKEGKREILVSKSSAVQAGSHEKDTFPINKDHSNMVKFSPDDPAYGLVLAYFRQSLHSLAAHLADATDYAHEALSIAPTFLRSAPDSRLVSSTSEADLLTAMQNSLSFRERQYRVEEIEAAHSGTCDWIFDSDTGFVDWSTKRDGSYWIRGKPGSGKSCLMKFLHDDQRCTKYLQHWTPYGPPLIAWFFFHARGSSLQQSWEGLLRSVLFQLAQKSLHISKIILPFYLESQRKKEPRDNWSLLTLERCLAAVLEQDTHDLNVVLFLDALDEYNDPPELIAEALKTLAAPSKLGLLDRSRDPRHRTRIKICFSSRPWDVFRREFSDLPGFYMHHKTEESIRRYCIDRLIEIETEDGSAIGRNDKMASGCSPAISSERSNPDDIDEVREAAVDTIVARAEGVFLWVHLVLDAVLKQYKPSSTPLSQLLHMELEVFPDKLEDFYEQTVQRIHSTNRAEAFLILETVYRADSVLYVKNLYYAVGCGLAGDYSSCREELQRRRNNGIKSHEMAVHLKNLCGGLLEVIDTELGPRIQFIHRTVTDFVGKPGFRKRMFGRYHHLRSENGYSTWFKYYLTIFSKDDRDRRRFDTTRFAMIAACKAESTTGRHQGQYLDSVPDHLFASMDVCFTEKTGCDSRFGFAAIAGLRLYLLDKISRQSIYSVTSPTSGTPLLHAAVTWAVFEVYNLPRVHGMPIAEIIRLLLDNGASSFPLRGCTPFELLFRKGTSGLKDHDVYVFKRAQLADIAEAFLDHGQDPNIRLNIICRPHFLAHSTTALKATNCTPLHLARSPMTETLLQYGASTDAEDATGCTPLDIAYGSSYGAFPYQRQPEEMLATVACLLEHKARCTDHGLRAYATFEERFTMKGRIRNDLLAHVKPEALRTGSVPRVPATCSSSRQNEHQDDDNLHDGLSFNTAQTTSSSRIQDGSSRRKSRWKSFLGRKKP